MNNRFDKIVPGLHNKLHLLVDISLAIVGVFLAMQSLRHDPHIISFCLAAATAWMLTAAVTRLYSPSTPRRLWDNLTLRAIGVIASTVALVLLAHLTPGLGAQPLDPVTFAVFYFCSGAVGRMLVFK